MSVPTDRPVDDSAEQVAATLIGIAESLDDDCSPLAMELSEMLRVRVGEAASFPSSAASELMREPTTAAERTAAAFLNAIAVYARDAGLDDQSLARLMRVAAVCAARFDSYIVERTAV
jgi:hypothetical protein